MTTDAPAPAAPTAGEATSVDDFSLFDPETLSCPYPFYAALRDSAPVYKSPELGVWLITRFDDVAAAFRDPASFRSGDVQNSMGGGDGVTINPFRESVHEVFKGGFEYISSLNFTDAPAHTRHRSLVNQAFSPRRAAAMRPTIRRIAEELVADWTPGDTVNLVDRFAAPLPIAVIGEALGIDPGDRDRFRSWSDAFARRIGTLLSEEEDVEESKRIVEFQHFLSGLIDQRVDTPADDMLGDLVAAKVEGEASFTKAELISIVTILLVAGNETTRNLISSTMNELLNRPDLLQKVRADRTLLPAVVEEALRLQSPVLGVFRVTATDVPIGDVTIPAGELVFLGIGSANVDPAHFDDPMSFDIDRPDVRSHLGFGWGTHLCVGANLARAEATIACETLLDTFASMSIAPGESVTYQPSITFRAMDNLPVVFEG